MRSFRPTQSSTQSISVSSSSQPLKLTDDQNGPTSVRVMNNGSAAAWIDFGPSGLVVTQGNGIPIPSGGVEVFTVQSTWSGGVYVAAIAAGSTGSIYFTLGTGI